MLARAGPYLVHRVHTLSSRLAVQRTRTLPSRPIVHRARALSSRPVVHRTRILSSLPVVHRVRILPSRPVVHRARILSSRLVVPACVHPAVAPRRSPRRAHLAVTPRRSPQCHAHSAIAPRRSPFAHCRRASSFTTQRTRILLSCPVLHRMHSGHVAGGCRRGMVLLPGTAVPLLHSGARPQRTAMIRRVVSFVQLYVSVRCSCMLTVALFLLSALSSLA